MEEEKAIKVRNTSQKKRGAWSGCVESEHVGIWIEMLNKQLDLYPGTENKDLSVFSPRIVVENVDMDNK